MQVAEREAAWAAQHVQHTPVVVRIGQGAYGSAVATPFFVSAAKLHERKKNGHLAYILLKIRGAVTAS
jgi:hypothetical protein